VVDDCFFVDFTNTSNDRERYESHTYGGVNLDLAENWQANAFSFVLVGAIMVFLLVSRFSSPKKAMAHWEEAMIKKYGSPALHINTEFYELSLAQSLREDEEQFVCDGYSSVKELVETENLFLLRHGKNQYYFVAKNGFRVGTADQFRSFIEQRIGGE